MNTKDQDKKRHTSNFPCPVCGGYKELPKGKKERCWGFTSEDGEWCHCTREEYAGPITINPESEAYAHKLNGPCNCGETHNQTQEQTNFSSRSSVVNTTEWIYRDEDRKPYLKVKRLDFEDGGKTYFPLTLINGKWTKGYNKKKPILYHLPEIIESDPNEPIYIAEGEKCVEALRKNGFVASCNPGGAGGSWKDYFSKHLSGRRCILLPDNDEAGENHVQKVAKSLDGKAALIRILKLPNLPKKGDVYDWFQNGGTAEELRQLAENTPEWERPPEPENSPDQPANGLSLRSDLTELGNAERFVKQHGENVRYCHAWKSWLVWNGNVWIVDDSEWAKKLMVDTIKKLYEEAAQTNDENLRIALANHARKSERCTVIKASLQLAEFQNGIPITPDELDSNPMLLTVKNGTINLETREFYPSRRKDFITKVAPVEHDENATCPRFKDFLYEIFDGDYKIIDFVQRAMGYSLTGDISEHCMFIPHGTGRNGKSTLIEIFSELMGDYALTTPVETLLLSRNGNSIPNDVARLKGARFVSAAESAEDRRLNEARIKSLTGGDKSSARFMRGEWFDFKPELKLWLSTNNKPVIKESEKAIWSRIRLIPFDQCFEGNEADKNLLQKLRGELPGILNWALDGLDEWRHRGGLEPPEKVMKAVEDYRNEMDTLTPFFEDCCIEGKEYKVSSKDLYAEYKQYCEESGEKPISQTKFGKRLRERGYWDKRTNTTRFWHGVALRYENEE